MAPLSPVLYFFCNFLSLNLFAATVKEKQAGDNGGEGVTGNSEPGFPLSHEGKGQKIKRAGRRRENSGGNRVFRHAVKAAGAAPSPLGKTTSQKISAQAAPAPGA